ncbi:hypothetical protein BD626DRAFT_587637 [Schizophyllum amplum]|uniref:Uncharacterized protein n=1 Tax=Schizophyllum amplum TaxID=97359 RepID=A0A550BTN5_9AGAR|nr:hypothetical protein BD626DRAFT_587637 [Auriculariopsis ampla]
MRISGCVPHVQGIMNRLGQVSRNRMKERGWRISRSVTFRLMLLLEVHVASVLAISAAAAKKNKGKRKATAADADEEGSAAASTTAKMKSFNMNTYKYHALGDYASCIAQLGTTDNSSTQVGESEHRRVKRFAPRTGKKDYAAGISKHVDRESLVNHMKQTNTTLFSTGKARDRADEDSPPLASPLDHHSIARSERNTDDVYRWALENRDDPAAENFVPRLKDHLLRREGCAPESGGDFSTQERSKIRLEHNELHWHKTMHVNYTTYDMRRAQDVINPSYHSDVLLFADEESTHPYAYARIIGIFHVNVFNSLLHKYVRTEVLWARWYHFDDKHVSGWKAKRLHRVGFEPGNSESAFGFIDPADVVRAAHLVPAFAQGQTTALLSAPSTLARRRDEEGKDYQRYYINMFADRDMFMRYRGGGLGHKLAPRSTQIFMDDRDDAGGNASTTNLQSTTATTADDHVQDDVPPYRRPELVEEEAHMMAAEPDELDAAADDEFDEDYWESDNEDKDESDALPERGTHGGEGSDIEEGFAAY